MKRTNFARRNLEALDLLDIEVADFVRHYTALRREPPESIGAVMRGVGVSWGAVYNSIRRLEKQGVLQREKRNRAPVLVRPK